MIEILKNPEFWTATAFILVIGIGVRPVFRFVKRWAVHQADSVRQTAQQAADMHQKAAALKEKYESAYRGRWTVQRKLMEQADTEVERLTAEATDQARDRMARRNQEIEIRLNMIADTGSQNIKGKMLAHVMADACAQAMQRRDDPQQTENADKVLQHTLQALDMYAPLLQK